jgi:hypothetical protein
MSFSKTLLQGVSDFWLRYFADVDIVARGHEAVLEAVGKQYQSMLLSVMRLSLQDTPLTEVSPWELLVIFDDQLIEVPTTDATVTYWLWELPTDIRDLAYVQNVALLPSALMERDLDFELIADDTARLDELRFYAPGVPTTGWFLLFYTDPFSWTATGEPIPGFGLNTSEYALGTRLTSPNVADWTTLGLSVGERVRVVHDDGVISHGKLSAITSGYLQVEDRTEMLSSAPGSATVGSDHPLYDDTLTATAVEVVAITTRVQAISGWAPAPERDFYSLYELYGYPLSVTQEPSTESYRAFVRGLWNIYIRGPVLTYIEAALGVISGYPVIRTNGELVTEIAAPAVGDIVIDTDQYELVNGVLTVIRGTSQQYLVPNGTPLTAAMIFSARTYLGELRDGTHTIFTDAAWLAAGNSFSSIGLVEGSSRVKVGVIEYEIQFVHAASLQVTKAAEIANDPTALPGYPSTISWDAVHDFGGGDVTLASGTAGDFLADDPVDTELSAFDSIADVFQVTDYAETPTWWYDTVIPPGLVPGLDPDRRTASTDLYPNEIGYSGYRGEIGDLGFYIGADEDGAFVDPTLGLAVLHDSSVDFVAAGMAAIASTPAIYLPTSLDTSTTPVTWTGPSTGSSVVLVDPENVTTWSFTITTVPDFRIVDASYKIGADFVEVDGVDYEVPGHIARRQTGKLRFGKPTRHPVAYILMDKFLKWNSFGVTIDADTALFPRGLAFLIGVLLEAKPAHTYPFVSSESELFDVFPDITDSSLTIVASGAPPLGMGGGGFGGGGFGV